MFSLQNLIKHGASFKQGASFLTKCLKLTRSPALILNASYFANFSTSTQQNQQLIQAYNTGLQAFKYCKHYESMPYFQRIISSITANSGQLSREDSLLLVQAYNRLGQALKKKERFAESFKEYLKGLKLIKSNNLEKTREAGLLYHSFAELSIEESQWEEARACLEKAKDIFSGLNEKPYLIENEYLMGVLYEKNNKTAEAIELWENILKSNKKIGKEFNIPQLYLSLGRIYLKEGNQQKAIEYLEKSIEVPLQHFGEDSLELLPVYVELTKICSDDKLGKEGLIYAEECVKVAEKHLKADDADLARYLTTLGNFYRKNRDHAQALEAYERALNIDLKYPNERPAEIAHDYLHVAEATALNGDHSKACEIKDIGEAFARKNLPPEHPAHSGYVTWKFFIDYV